MKAAEPSGKRRRRSPEDIMVRLLTAAEEVFKAHGYAGGTTAAIARRAEVTEAQLFRYFPSKAALFRKAMVASLDDHLQEFLARQGDGASPERIDADARAYIAELQDFVTRHRELFFSLITAEAYEHADVAGVSGVDSLVDYFAHGAASLRLHTQGNGAGDPALAVRVSFAAVLASILFQDWLFAGQSADEPAVRQAVADFVLYGIYGRSLLREAGTLPRQNKVSPAAAPRVAAEGEKSANQPGEVSTT